MEKQFSLVNPYFFLSTKFTGGGISSGIEVLWVFFSASGSWSGTNKILFLCTSISQINFAKNATSKFSNIFLIILELMCANVHRKYGVWATWGTIKSNEQTEVITKKN